MPTYDYHCDTCGATFEWFQSMKDAKLTTCPEAVCKIAQKGKGSVQRKISGGSGLIFNGDGFYSTDYVKKSGAPSTKPASASSDAAANSTPSASNSSSDSSTSSSAATPSASSPSNTSSSSSSSASE